VLLVKKPPGVKLSPEQVNIYDVARAAGVSISTVSNALNRPHRVAAATLDRVLALADSLGYVPKADAVSKARQTMRRIGVLAPFSSYRSYLERLAGVLVEAQGAKVEVSAFDHESLATASSPLLASMPIRGQVDGIIVMGMRIEDVIEKRLFDRRVPTVVVDAESSRFPRVACDDRSGGEMAARYLFGLGHRSFGYVVEPQASQYDSQALRRFSGFRDALASWPECTVQLVEAGSSTQAARLATMAMLDRPNRPTAIMAHYDDLAIGALLAAKDAGIVVPEEFSVMGCDDGPGAVASDLTTIRQPFRESGAVAVRLLLATINASDISRSSVYLPLEVVERSTTCPPKSGGTGANGSRRGASTRASQAL
jgi:DNA-binding LacI/PurR family transcriptional regulator